MTDTGFGRRVLQGRLNLAASRGRTISQVEVGKALDVTGVTVGRWESGEKEPDLQTIVRLAAYLGVSPGWLAFGEQGGVPAATPPQSVLGPNAVATKHSSQLGLPAARKRRGA